MRACSFFVARKPAGIGTFAPGVFMVTNVSAGGPVLPSGSTAMTT